MSSLTQTQTMKDPRVALGLIIALIVAAYYFALQVPLMDSDAAHHANIAMRMVLTGDYISLIDKGQPYLDKPHLLFWTSALSFKTFGINTFAYKFPSLLFTILTLLATYKLGSRLYSRKVGLLAAMILASSFAFVLANSDVRMDAILAAGIAFSAWQYVEYYHSRSWKSLIATAFGLSIGFMTKGMIGPAVPTIVFFFYLLGKQDFRFFLDKKLYLILPLFLIFSSPVLYAYYQQFDLHPELEIRGRSEISGVKFILWDQNFERFQGEAWDTDDRKDYFFFVHTIMWAFIPWSLFFFFALYQSFKTKLQKHFAFDGMTVAGVLFLLILYSFAGFKLPHYLNTLLPFMAVITAAAMVKMEIPKAFQYYHLLIIILVLLTVLALNLYAFPMSMLGLASILVTMALAYYLIFQTSSGRGFLILFTAATGAFINLLMQANFYPQLLQYQGGSALAERVEQHQIPHENLYYFSMLSFSFDFYSQHLHGFVDQDDISSLIEENPIYLYINQDGFNHLKHHTPFRIETIEKKDAYHVSKAKPRFILPSTREEALNPHYIVRVSKPN